MPKNDNDILQYAIDNGIINLQYIQQQIDMDKRKKILESHPYKIVYNNKKGRWYTRFKSDNGVIQRNRASKDELEDLIVMFYENGESFVQKDSIYTFSQAHDRWLEVQKEYGKSPNTIYKYESDWRRFFMDTHFNNMNILTMTPHDIEAFMINTITTMSLKKQAGVDLFVYINGVFYSAVMDRRIPKDENPCDLVDKKRFDRFYNKEKKSHAQRVLSFSEIEKLINRLNYDVSERPTSLSPYGVRLSLLTGMRSGEICGLRWSNVTDTSIIICESEKYNQLTREYYISGTKTEKDRTMPITEGLQLFLNDMKKLQEQYGITDDFVISTSIGKLHTRNLSDYMVKASKKLGFDISKNIHSIRRTFNSYLREGGTSALLAGSIIGNTAEVNENYYTYDICDMDTKYRLVTDVENKLLANLRFA